MIVVKLLRLGPLVVRGSGKIVVFRDHDPEHMIETYIESNIGGKILKWVPKTIAFPLRMTHL
jgi:hypothetical protein